MADGIASVAVSLPESRAGAWYSGACLLCAVRGCHLPLTREERRVFCPRGHSFDIARTGYINLLQPQDRRSKNPGDSAEAVAARRRLHDLGVTEPLLQGIGDILNSRRGEVVLDAGCGDGFYTGSLATRFGLETHGVDISVPAIDAAARRYPGYEWIVANADRFMPYEAGAFSIVVSITARMNSQEFRRVLREDGRLLVALAAPDDLIELRGVGRHRVDRTVESFAREFTPVDCRRVTTTADLDIQAVEDVMTSIYRPLRSGSLEAMRVTFSLDLLLFRPL
jgi:23S rRNA (guanine745-N1)-methyltransferase